MNSLDLIRKHVLFGINGLVVFLSRSERASRVNVRLSLSRYIFACNMTPCCGMRSQGVGFSQCQGISKILDSPDLLGRLKW
jgi:hypothetical protein